MSTVSEHLEAIADKHVNAALRETTNELTGYLSLAIIESAANVCISYIDTKTITTFLRDLAHQLENDKEIDDIDIGDDAHDGC